MFFWYTVAGSGLIFAAALARRRNLYEDLCMACGLSVFLLLLVPISLLEIRLAPVTMDAQLRAADLALGLDGFALTRFCLHHRSIASLLVVVYESLPLAFAAAWASERSTRLLRACLVASLAVMPFYLIFPAVGPEYAFANWPYGETLAPSSGLHPRNCMPSLHFTWALLLFLNVRSRWLRPIFAVYAGLMIFATVGVGEHYFIDLLAALPYTALIQLAAAPDRRFLGIWARQAAPGRAIGGSAG